jgi:hypothetical protein
MSKISIEFQEYELDIILKALQDAHYKEISTNGKWEKMEGGSNYSYSQTKKSRQIKFTINSINRHFKKQEEV